MWPLIKSSFEDYRDEGHSREAAFAMARLIFPRHSDMKAMNRGMEEGQEKAEARMSRNPIWYEED
jgi:hypothetical protein